MKSRQLLGLLRNTPGRTFGLPFHQNTTGAGTMPVPEKLSEASAEERYNKSKVTSHDF